MQVRIESSLSSINKHNYVLHTLLMQILHLILNVFINTFNTKGTVFWLTLTICKLDVLYV